MNKFLSIMLGLATSISCKHVALENLNQNNLVKVSDKQIQFTINNNKIKLGAFLYSPKQHSHNAFIIMVPGSGNVSRLGTVEGDGIHPYEKAIALSHERSMGLAAAGFTVLSYDKRSCATVHDPLCNNNFTDDIQKQGPVALASDVDAVCDFAHAYYSNKKLILWGSDQAMQVILASQCAAKADLLVFVSPITQRIDSFMIQGLQQAAQQETDERLRLKLTRRFQSLNETFMSLEKGLFPKNANVLGASVDFWHSWLSLTTHPFANAKKLSAYKIYAFGNKDPFVAGKAKEILRQQIKNSQSKMVDFAEVDKNLLKNSTLYDVTEQAMQDLIISILNLAS